MEFALQRGLSGGKHTFDVGGKDKLTDLDERDPYWGIFNLDNMLEVKEVDDKRGRGVFAAVEVPAGMRFIEPLKLVRGLAQGHTPHDVQIDRDSWARGGPFLRYANHSCRPSCRVVAVEVSCVDDAERSAIIFETLIPLYRGKELTWDYATAEWGGSWKSFYCYCGEVGCRERVTGFVDLTIEQQQAIMPLVTGYVARRLREKTA